MESILLTHPILQWLEPADRHRIRALNKEHRDAIDAHTATQTTYTVRMYPVLSWRAREALYARYPKVETLTYECGWPNTIGEVLRPTLQRLHIQVPLQVVLDPEFPDLFQWDWARSDDILTCLRELTQYLERTPEAQLQHLQISFLNDVKLRFIDEVSTIVDYDRDGPIYEESDVLLTDTYGSPEVYFSIMEQCPRLNELGELVKALSEVRPWKSFSLPAELPGASEISFATLAEPCEKDEETIESLWEHIQILRYRASRAHREEVVPFHEQTQRCKECGGTLYKATAGFGFCNTDCQMRWEAYND